MSKKRPKTLTLFHTIDITKVPKNERRSFKIRPSRQTCQFKVYGTTIFKSIQCAMS